MFHNGTCKNKYFKKQEVKKPSTGRTVGNDQPALFEAVNFTMNTSLVANQQEEDMKGAGKANKDESTLLNRKPTTYQTFALKMKNKQLENESIKQ